MAYTHLQCKARTCTPHPLHNQNKEIVNFLFISNTVPPTASKMAISVGDTQYVNGDLVYVTSSFQKLTCTVTDVRPTPVISWDIETIAVTSTDEEITVSSTGLISKSSIRNQYSPGSARAVCYAQNGVPSAEHNPTSIYIDIGKN